MNTLIHLFISGLRNVSIAPEYEGGSNLDTVV